MVTQERLREVLRYEPETGDFFWLLRRGCRGGGAKAGSIKKFGYVEIQVDGQLYQAHRLAWLYVHGAWPRVQLDHINNEPSDNRIRNLRECTQSQNNVNRRVRRGSVSGFKGVYRRKRDGKWIVQIRKPGEKTKHLGVFAELEAAVDARTKAAVAIFGEFARVR